jgi:hypothetical protein
MQIKVKKILMNLSRFPNVISFEKLSWTTLFQETIAFHADNSELIKDNFSDWECWESLKKFLNQIMLNNCINIRLKSSIIFSICFEIQYH